jgi:F-type H+-transporting ATPase subunit b
MATNTTAHTEVPAGHKTVFPPFQSETFPSQILWIVLTFVGLYLLMSKVALPRVGSILDERSARIAADLAAAQRFREQSDAAMAAYEKALAEARARAQAIANETRQQQALQAEEMRKVLEAQLEQKLAEAERTIAATKTAAMANVRAIAADAAAAIVERLIGITPSPQEVAAAVEDALKR